ERLYQPDIHGVEERKSGQAAIYYCLLNILKMYGIFVPHMTEYIYQDAFAKAEGIDCLHQNLWSVDGEDDEESIAFGEYVKDAISEVRKFKSENNISMKSEVESMKIVTPEKFKGAFDKTLGDIVACCHAKTVEFEIQ
ncbi:MAG TPA: valine--tRNA ligase, partial [Ruminococcaceae bacterium]|nr:valine--tRNA ligase [Oscillospiraceae bacterium]